MKWRLSAILSPSPGGSTFGGLASYYEVLEAQQLLYPAEISLSETSRDRRLAIVQLYRALGGGWNFDNTQWTNGRQ